MDITRIDGYTDSRFSREVLDQHGAFLVDGRPWAFRIVSDRAAVVTAEALEEEPLKEAVELFRFYSGHITEFYTEGGRCLLRLPPVERREVDIDFLQPTQFSVDRDKCRAVGSFIRSPAGLVIPVAELDGALCTLDGHTRLYTAWGMGIRRTMVFDSPLEPGQREIFAGFVREARRRGIFHIGDMALYGHEEQEEKWAGWCRAYFRQRASECEKEQSGGTYAAKESGL